ncbi:hypothetical protein BDV06DRAFT_235085 [Aspergillus oleicola]
MRQRLFQANTLCKIVLTMSDQQLVTGIAILQIITTLTWFSTITHLGTLPFLKQYLRRHRYIFYLRVFLIFGLAIMLAIALLPNGNGLYRGTLTIPIQCFINSPNIGFDIREGGAFTIMAEIILLLTLLVRFVRILPVSKDVSSKLLRSVRDAWRRSLVSLCERCRRFPRYTGLITVPPLVFGIAWLALAHMLVDLFRSTVFEIWWLMLSLIWSSIRLFSVRAALPRKAQRLEEDQWGFGQLVPVLLLIIPILMISESWSDSADTTQYLHIALPEATHSSLHVYFPVGPSIPLVSSSNLSLAPPSNSSIYTRLMDAATNDLVTGAEFLIMYVCMLLFGGILCLTTHPLCGIISLEPRTLPRHSLSIIRITTDTGKTYRRLRRIFYVCFPILVTGLSEDHMTVVPMRKAPPVPVALNQICLSVDSTEA